MKRERGKSFSFPLFPAWISSPPPFPFYCLPGRQFSSSDLYFPLEKGGKTYVAWAGMPLKFRQIRRIHKIYKSFFRY